MADILHRLHIAASPARVYAALTLADEVGRWWTSEVALDGRVGGAGRFGFGDGRVKTCRIEALDPAREVVWKVTACFLPEWIGTHIAFRLEDATQGALLHFAHTGLPEAGECLALCTTGWGTYLERLRRLCEGASHPLASSPFIVHSIPGSPFGRAVLATLEEKRAPYRFATVASGTLRAEPHVLRHPFGKVPVLEADGLLLYEAQAILRFLERTLPEPALAPRNARAAARMDQLMNINDWYLFQGVGNVIGFQRIVRPRVMGLEPDEAAIAAVMPKAHEVMAEVSRLLGDGLYLAGETFSLADLMIAPQLDFLAQTPEWEPLTVARANVVRYLERVEARPSMQATTWAKVAEMATAA